MSDMPTPTPTQLPTAKLGPFEREVAELRNIYASDARGDTFRGIIGGRQGSGKTSLALTCPKPVHIDSFDPGGTEVLREAIEKGSIFADIRFEGENPDDPKMFALFDAALDRRLRSGYFDNIGTYILDSLTTLGAAALNAVIKERLKKNRKKDKEPSIVTETPQRDDWQPQMTLVSRVIRKIAALPCHVLVTAHLKPIKNEDGALLSYELLVTGRLQELLPIHFSEIYILETKDSPQGVKRALLTQSSGLYTAKTRIGRLGRFDKWETPDIRALLQKAGKTCEDKPIPN